MTEQEINNLIDSKIGKTKMSQLPEATQTSGLYSIGYTGNQSVKYKASLLQGDPLTVRKTYQTEALALADKNPIDPSISLPLEVGQFVSIVNDTTTSKNGIYRISSISADGTMSLELQGKLGDLSEYAKQSDLENDILESFNNRNIINESTKRENTWVIYEDGKISATPKSINTYTYIIKSGDKKIVSKLHLDKSPAAIAFYNTDIPSTSSYMKDVSIQSIYTIGEGTHIYESTIPEGAVTCVMTSFVDNENMPIIVVEGSPENLNYVLETEISKLKGEESEIVVIRDEEPTIDESSINTIISISDYPNGTIFKFRVDDLSGDDTFGLIRYYGEDSKKVRGDDIVSYVGEELLFEKSSDITNVRPSKAREIGNVFNYTLSVEHKSNQLILPFNGYTTSLAKVSLGEFSTGWRENFDAKNTSPTWVTTSFLFFTNISIRLNIDFDTYFLSIAKFNRNATLRTEFTVTSQEQIIDLTNCYAWTVQFRRIDRVHITPEEVKNELTLVEVIGNNIIEKSAPISYVNEKIKGVENKIDVAEFPEILNYSKSIYNPFVDNPYYGHLFIDAINRSGDIPSQSLADVDLSARLGFKFIEANVMITSDGVPITLHGISGKFGGFVESLSGEDITDVLINTKTLSWIKENVRYKTSIPKYRTSIPTLYEFLKACSVNDIGIFVQSEAVADTVNNITSHTVTISKNYLGEDKVIAYGKIKDRAYTDGYIFTWSSLSTKEDIVNQCKSVGRPYMHGMKSKFLTMDTESEDYKTDEELRAIIDAVHAEGCLIGSAACYMSNESEIRAKSLGFDYFASGWHVNKFNYGNVHNLSAGEDFSEFTTDGSIIEGELHLTDGQTVTIPDPINLFVSKKWLNLMFTGKITVNMSPYIDGSKSKGTFESDGGDFTVLSTVNIKGDSGLVITANGDVIIKELVYKCSKC